MSAIVGRIDFSGRPVDPGMFDAAMVAVAHYGGDSTGRSVDGPVALGHHFRAVARRAAPEHQPVTRGPLTIVADTILDNRAEVAAALAIAPPEARLIADSDLMLRAYERWGADCLNRFRGDYAMAVWNAATRTLFLARDHIGTRPLYWRREGQTVVFATDVRGLVAMTDLSWEIDESAIATFLTAPSEPVGRGYFKGLHICPPGHWVCATSDNSMTQRWWCPADLAPEHHNKLADYAVHLRHLLDRAVEDRIDTDLGVGSHISGGIDSTSISVIAQRQLQANGGSLKRAYSWSPPLHEEDPDCVAGDERRTLTTIADNERINVGFCKLGVKTYLRFLDDPIELNGSVDFPDEINVMDKAKSDGVQLMLSGWGGDECFSAHGVGYLSDALRSGNLITSLRYLRRTAGLRHPLRAFEVLYREGALPQLPDAIYYRLGHDANIFKNRSFIAPSLATRPRTDLVPIRNRGSVHQHVWQQLTRGHIAMRLENWCAMGAERSLRYRFPLLDKALLDFLIPLPREVLYPNGRSRYLAVSAVRDCFGSAVLTPDPANERRRTRARIATWKSLSEDERTIKAVCNCPWLDKDALIRHLKQVPEDIERQNLAVFIELCSAIRVANSYRRTYPT